MSIHLFTSHYTPVFSVNLGLISLRPSLLGEKCGSQEQLESKVKAITDETIKILTLEQRIKTFLEVRKKLNALINPSSASPSPIHLPRSNSGLIASQSAPPFSSPGNNNSALFNNNRPQRTWSDSFVSKSNNNM